MSKFIAIEGLDGVGKSTQIKLLFKYFEGKNITPNFVHFPRAGQGIYGDLIAKYLRGEFGNLDALHPQIVSLLFAGDRHEFADTMKEWIDREEYILVDRYVYSNIAFQGAKLKETESSVELAEWILNLEFVHNKIPKPTISLYLELPISFVKNSLKNKRVGSDRDYLEGKEDIHENDMDFQFKVKKVYDELLERNMDLTRIKCYDENDAVFEPIKIHSLILEQLKLCGMI